MDSQPTILLSKSAHRSIKSKGLTVRFFNSLTYLRNTKRSVVMKKNSAEIVQRTYREDIWRLTTKMSAHGEWWTVSTVRKSIVSSGKL